MRRRFQDSEALNGWLNLNCTMLRYLEVHCSSKGLDITIDFAFKTGWKEHVPRKVEGWVR
jgi:hypothetical protein